MKKLTYYQERIRTICAKLGYIGKYDPRHIEAYVHYPLAFSIFVLIQFI